MLLVIFQILDILLNVARWIIIIQAILSWLFAFNVISLRNPALAGIWNGLDQLTEPMYRPIRRIMPDFGALDLSPMVVLILLIIAQDVLLPYLYVSLASAGLA